MCLVLKGKIIFKNTLLSYYIINQYDINKRGGRKKFLYLGELKFWLHEKGKELGTLSQRPRFIWTKQRRHS